MAMLACSFLKKHPSKLKIFIDFSNNTKIITSTRFLHGPPKVNEYSEVPLYPPIPKFKNKKESNADKTKNFMAKLGTVEEKQYHINRPKNHGWYSYMLSQNWIPCDSKEFLQFATQTHLVDGLPNYYSDKDETVDKLVDEIAPLVEQSILNHSLYTEYRFEVPNDNLPMRDHNANFWTHGKQWRLQHLKSRALLKSIHQIVMGSLVGRYTHLEECSEDFDSRNDAFWFRGGIAPDKSMLSKREGSYKKLQKRGAKMTSDPYEDLDLEDAKQPYERAIQYKGCNNIQLRTSEPLPPFIDRDDPLVTQSKVPIVAYDPRTWGFKAKCQHGTNVPGVWPDADHQHGLLLYSDRTNNWTTQAVHTEGALGSEVARDQNTAKALLSCFGWLLPQACHLGFSPMTEITFPLATQATLTDGQAWNFYAYQLNTTDLTTNSPEEHTHNNVMWVGKDMTLYDRVEEGKVINFTPSTLAPLVKMYLKEPKTRQYSLTPYLSSVKTVSNFHEPFQRKLMLETIRNVYSNRPKHRGKPEMYLWEKLHLVDHFGPWGLGMGLRRRRWFQQYKVSHLGRNHWHPEFESLDKPRGKYIPKAMRPEDFMRKKGLGRRYNKYAPNLTVPLEDAAAVYKLPKIEYQPEE